MLTWLIALPLIAVGSQVAHGIAYWWAYPAADVRAAILQHSGHGYGAYAPRALGFVAAIELLVLVVAVVDRARKRESASSLPPWAFLWLPIVGFTLQEHLERFFTAGVFPWWTVEQPTFWRGLLLQIPLGLVAYGIARLLLRTVDAVAVAIGSRHGSRPRLRLLPPLSVPRPHAALVRSAPLALAAAGRAPPSRLG